MKSPRILLDATTTLGMAVGLALLLGSLWWMKETNFAFFFIPAIPALLGFLLLLNGIQHWVKQPPNSVPMSDRPLESGLWTARERVLFGWMCAAAGIVLLGLAVAAAGTFMWCLGFALAGFGLLVAAGSLLRHRRDS